MAKVISIIKKQIITETLHNLAVQDDESYVANGIVVHNCNSSIEPILSGELKGREIKPLDRNDADLDNQIQFHDHTNCSHLFDHEVKEWIDLIKF